ncbi:MAG: hypothetical protein ACXVMS_01325 [Flavisolibacter sp.]
MNRKTNQPKESLHHEELIQKVLKSNKKLFPETVEEVMEFEQKYGTTDIILPEELQEPTFLYSFEEADVINTPFQYVTAVAARNENEEIPGDIRKRMDEDRKKAKVTHQKKKHIR